MSPMMDTDYVDDEVVENPTLKAAYNLAPLHQNQLLKWNFEVDLIGKKVFDKVLHLCEACKLPILIYGRLSPCKHIFCFDCARDCGESCKRCGLKVQKLEELALGTVYVCSYDDPKNNKEDCRRAYLSQRDLQSHIVHRHMPKPNNESKTTQAGPQPQLPLTQQQAAALQHSTVPSSSAVPHSQTNYMTSNVNQLSQQQHNLSASSPYLQANASQYTHQTIPGLNNSRNVSNTSSVSSVNTSINQTGHLNRGLSYNQPPLDQGVYRSIDRPSLIQQQQQPMLHQQRPQIMQQGQLQQQRMLLPHSQGSTMPPNHATQTGGMRFSQATPNVSSSLMQQQSIRQNPAMNQYQTSNMGSGSDLQMSAPFNHQMPTQNTNLPQGQLPGNVLLQRGVGGQAQPLSRQQSLDMNPGLADYDHRQQSRSMDNFGSTRQNLDNFNSSQNMVDSDMRTLPPRFNNNPQINRTFNNQQDINEYGNPQKMDSNFNNNQNNRTNAFNNSSSSGIMPPTNSNNQANLQSGMMPRGKNVNLITVPLQDEGQFRPMPSISQSLGGGNVPNTRFSSNNSLSSLNTGPRPMNRMSQPIFNRAPNPRALHSPSMMDNCNLSQSSNMNFSDQPRFTPPMNNSNSNSMLNNPSSISGGVNNPRMPMRGISPTSSLSDSRTVQFNNQGPRFNAPGRPSLFRAPANSSGMIPPLSNQGLLNNPQQPAGNWPDDGNRRTVQQRIGHQNFPPQNQGDSGYQRRNYF